MIHVRPGHAELRASEPLRPGAGYRLAQSVVAYTSKHDVIAAEECVAGLR
jgi:hypothetical protein